MVLVAEIAFCVFCATQLVLLIILDEGFLVGWMCFILPNFSLAIIFGITFWRLTKLSKQLDEIFCNTNLMWLHYMAFVVAVFCDVILLCIDFVKLSYADDALTPSE